MSKGYGSGLIGLDVKTRRASRVRGPWTTNTARWLAAAGVLLALAVLFILSGAR